MSESLENVHFHDTNTEHLVATIKYVVKVLNDSRVLHSKQDKESNHQTEQSHGFRQGKSQDGIREQLLLQRWVPAKKNNT